LRRDGPKRRREIIFSAAAARQTSAVAGATAQSHP